MQLEGALMRYLEQARRQHLYHIELGFIRRGCRRFIVFVSRKPYAMIYLDTVDHAVTQHQRQTVGREQQLIVSIPWKWLDVGENGQLESLI